MHRSSASADSYTCPRVPESSRLLQLERSQSNGSNRIADTLVSSCAHAARRRANTWNVSTYTGIDCLQTLDTDRIGSLATCSIRRALRPKVLSPVPSCTIASLTYYILMKGHTSPVHARCAVSQAPSDEVWCPDQCSSRQNGIVWNRRRVDSVRTLPNPRALVWTPSRPTDAIALLIVQPFPMRCTLAAYRSRVGTLILFLSCSLRIWAK